MQQELYFIRHGQTDYNMLGIIQGRGVNTDLNKNGQEQAIQFYRLYKNEGFELVLTSTLKRSIQSIQHFIDSGLPHIQLESLDEMHLGHWEGKEAKGEIRGEWNQITESWKNGQFDLSVPGGESPSQLRKRQEDFVEFIKGRKEQKILICMHGRALRSMMCLLSGLDPGHMDDFAHENFCLYRVKWNGALFEISHRNIPLA